jgi:membrane-associated phospholipid phosphatase
MSPFDRFVKTMLKPWMVLSYFAFVIVSFFYFDIPVASWCHGLNLRNNMPVFYQITLLGTGGAYILLLCGMALFFRYVYHNQTYEARCWLLWLCVLIPYAITLVLKSLFGRARPELWFDEQLFGFYGLHFNKQFWSFPSGHTTTIMGLMFGLCILFPRYLYAFLAAGLCVVATRVLLTNHYLSDVMATSYLVLMEIAVLWAFLSRKKWFLALS